MAKRNGADAAQTQPKPATATEGTAAASPEIAPAAILETATDPVTAAAAPPATATDEAAAAEPAPAAAVTATAPEPEAPAAAAPASATEEDQEQEVDDEVQELDQDVGTAAAEAEDPAFIRFLEAEAKKAELAMQSEAHAWLLGLQHHLTGLKLHLERIPEAVHEDFHELAANVKALF